MDLKISTIALQYAFHYCISFLFRCLAATDAARCTFLLVQS